MTWIANGESGLSVRTKLNKLAVPVASAAITSPVSYVDITLPTGYDRFELAFVGLKLSADDYVCAALSSNAGSSFIADAINFDTWAILQSLIYGDGANLVSDPSVTTTFNDSLIYVTGAQSKASAAFGICGTAIIDPGSAARYAEVISDSVFRDAYVDTNPIIDRAWVASTIFTNATSPPSFGSANLMRLQPYGNGDCNPPTSNHTFTAGSYFLFGVPTP